MSKIKDKRKSHFVTSYFDKVKRVVVRLQRALLYLRLNFITTLFKFVARSSNKFDCWVK